MSGSDGDLISGDLGERVDRAAVGKGIQQMIVALDTTGMNTDALHRVLDIVLGDGVMWDGVMKELERLRTGMQALTTEMQAVKSETQTVKAEMQTVKAEMQTLKVETHARCETSVEMLWMLRIVLVIAVAFAAVYGWQVW